MLFWLILFIIVAVLSFLLALRSTKNAEQKIKAPTKSQTLFLIRTPEAINGSFLEKLHRYLLEEKSSVSFERLFKGKEQALSLYGPEDLPTKFPELGFLELEDYLISRQETFVEKNPTKINADQAFIWNISIKPGMGEHGLFASLELQDEEQFFFQLIFKPILDRKDLEVRFRLTTRAMVATKNRLDKVKLAKKIFNSLNSKLGIDSQNLNSSPQAFEKYQFRLPAEDKQSFSASNFFNISEVLKLLTD